MHDYVPLLLFNQVFLSHFPSVSAWPTGAVAVVCPHNFSTGSYPRRRATSPGGFHFWLWVMTTMRKVENTLSVVLQKARALRPRFNVTCVYLCVLYYIFSLSRRISSSNKSRMSRKIDALMYGFCSISCIFAEASLEWCRPTTFADVSTISARNNNCES